MTEKQQRTKRRRRLPRHDDVAGISLDPETGRAFIVTKDTLLNQLHRDGPKIRRSFDDLSSSHIRDCSELLAIVQTILIRHLSSDNDGFKGTSARLIWYGVRTLIASIEVARCGYRRAYGVLARTVIETIATAIYLILKEAALDQFHTDTLQSTKCITAAKAVFPPLGSYYGMLSKEFVHVGRQHAVFEPSLSYSQDDPSLSFILHSLRANTWMLYVAAELAFHDEVQTPRYWFRVDGQRVAYNPSESERTWMARFLEPDELGES